jgi:hypothetical protein
VSNYREFDTSKRKFNPTVLRSTIPAAAVFTTEALVDTRLATEFFKHLPGLFTGIGIIGTFWGLIQGLQAFRVSADPAIVRTSLEGLMHRVSDAFIVSGSAIFAAMVATFLEKLFITVLYRKVEEITSQLDSMFDSGASEEYLARLVKASEESADQSKILKDALITDLEHILSNLTDRQIQAQAQGSQALAEHFTNSVTVGLQGPLERLAETFSQTSQGNSQAVTQLLSDVLAGFSQKLQELFGGQISGINQLQQKTIQSLESAVAKLEQMASTVETAGAKTSEAMGQRLVDALGAMESHQKLMNERMTAFVEQLRTLVSDSQSETNQKLQATLTEIGEAARAQISALEEQGDHASASHSDRETRITMQTQEMLGRLGAQVDTVFTSLQAQSDQVAAAQVEREQRVATQTNETVAKLTSLTEGLLEGVRAVTAEVRDAVQSMRSATSDTVSRMNSGAETMFLAADEFTKAGAGVAGVLQQTAGISSDLREAAGSVSAASATLNGVVADHANTRTTFARMLEELNERVENAKTQASLTSDVLARIESASQRLGRAQLDAENYLAGVSQVLTSTNAAFSESLNKVLGDAYNEFMGRLSEATGLLREAIEELAIALVPTQRRA